ncbi:uncharacterized protein (TIGR04141 family) [Flavobacterium araucananum]|uniref:TIGR04141 family sporadically distributed protein n=1 Tax=Flavobacterium araucananum TaxID=946678 RepID=A0A227NPN1_9FLAO|nr:DUF6119 family protein [Flavobacterium araucananum]OXE99722.1 hypothetical protein B0A64_21055 [Flavobacterium araucananum]PWJ95573.1 uncharacterized protein (TIGR04141 family) [Flavobacterium araucananum]
MKQNPTVYKIEKTHKMSSVVKGVQTHLENNIKQFVVRDIELKGYKAKLIVIQSTEKESEWANFFPKKYVEGISLEYQIPSILVLIETPSGIFSIVGGGFYKYILPFLDTSYGLNTYSRIMNPVQDEIISIKTRGVTGLRAGMSEQFKDSYRLMDYIKFGKIPTELKIKLSIETAELYFNQFLTTRSPNIILNISCGFNINKSLSFEELTLLVEILEYVETKKADDFFSSYKEITDKNIISNSLKPAIINELFNKRTDIINKRISNFDLCYPNKIEDFYGADDYEIKLKEDKNKYKKIARTSDKSEILRIILRFLSSENFDSNLSNFSFHIHNIYIYTYKNQSKKPILSTTLIYHLNTELSLPDLGTYIYLDSKWYKLREIFVKEMNQRCKEILNANDLKNSIIDKEWEKKANGKREDESSYNDKYIKDKYLVLDTITIDSIELADIIHIQKDIIYLCHIKYGFSTEMRELYSQIISSARRLKNDLKDEKNEYLKANYKSLKAKNKSNGFSEEAFIKLFKTKDIKYVMCISSHLKNKPLQKSMEKYTSNIAKLSLIQCFTEMRTEYYDLSFEIIKNDKCFN